MQRSAKQAKMPATDNKDELHIAWNPANFWKLHYSDPIESLFVDKIHAKTSTSGRKMMIGRWGMNLWNKNGYEMGLTYETKLGLKLQIPEFAKIGYQKGQFIGRF